MKHVIILCLVLGIAGCATGRDQQPQFGKSNPAAYHYQMGLSYLGERNYTSALIELNEAEKLDPENPDLLYNLGLAYIAKKRPDLAEQRLQKAILLKPNNSSAREALGNAYLDLKRWDNAIQQFQIVKDDLFYEGSESASISLGLAFLSKGDYQKAMAELRVIATGNPRNARVHLSLGRVWFAMENTEQAVNEYKKALDIHSDYGAAHYYLGLAYLKLNNAEAARASFKEAARIIPDTDLGRSSIEKLDLLK
jgi:type IV pilus assembly protein PilF